MAVSGRVLFLVRGCLRFRLVAALGSRRLVFRFRRILIAMKVALISFLEIGLVPALALEAKTWCRQEPLQAGPTARRALHKPRIRYFLQRVERVITFIAGVCVYRQMSNS